MTGHGFDYARCDATGLAQAIADRVLSPSEAVAEAFSAIRRVNQRLNAVILEMEEAAADQLENLPVQAPLRGVPVLLKDDCPSYAGVEMSFGCRAAAGNVSTTDHELVSRYRAAGLVMVGKTNLPEMSCNVTTEPTLHGPTLNPWNVERSVGGSSGGAAAAVASGMVPIAYGNDGAGSIRIPASCTGLFGLRPSRGRVPCGPVSVENWGGLVSHHVLTRSVRDSALMLDLTSAPEQGALYAAPSQDGTFVEALSAPARPLRIGMMAAGRLNGATDGEVSAALEDATALLRSLGHSVQPARPDFDPALLVEALTKLVAAYTALEIDDIARSFGKAQDDANFEPVNLGLADYGRSLSGPEVLAARNVASSVARSFGRFFSQFDLLVTPVMPNLPLPLGVLDVRGDDWKAFVARLMAATVFTHPANAAGIPAMSVPLAWSSEGLPIGIQLLAPYGAEARLLNLAARLERECPWADRRPSIHA